VRFFRDGKPKMPGQWMVGGAHKERSTRAGGSLATLPLAPAGKGKKKKKKKRAGEHTTAGRRDGWKTLSMNKGKINVSRRFWI